MKQMVGIRANKDRDAGVLVLLAPFLPLSLSPLLYPLLQHERKSVGMYWYR